MNRVTEKIRRSEKNHGHMGHRKVKCELIQALVMINLVKFNAHSSNAKKFIVLKVANRRTNDMTTIVILKKLHVYKNTML